MKKSIKRVVSLSLCAAMAAGSLAGCSSKKAEPADTTTTAAAETTTKAGGETAAEGETTEGAAASDKPFDGVTLKYATTQTASTGEENQKLIELVKEKTGINIEFFVIPNAKSGEVDKTLVSLMAGDEIDLIYNTKPGLKAFYNAGVLEPMNALAETAGYDIAGTFGDYVPEFGGDVYGLPAFSDIWITLYNNIETAKKLTDSSKGIYGSLMLDYDCYNYMYALQKGWEPYKADGTANFDDPLFKESLEFYYGLGNTEKIQPSILEFKASNTPWNAFATTGKYGMFMCGGWVTSILNQFDKYPRDWKVGLLPMPYPEGTDPSTLTVPGCYAVPTTSKNKDAAFAAAACMAENQYTLGMGRVPARIDLTDEEINEYVENSLAKPFEFDGLTVEDFKTAWFDSSRKALSEKIIGDGDAAISQAIIEEGQLYGQGAESIDDAVTKIQDKANRAIEEDKQ